MEHRTKDSAVKAFTLFELLITFIFISILLGATWMVYNTGFKMFYSQLTRSGIKAELGQMVINIGRELRQAASVAEARQTNLTFNADTDFDGIAQTLQYTWSGVSGEPLYRISDVTTAVVNSVSGLAFSYYDANNNLLDFPVTASLVRLVGINASVIDKEEAFQLSIKVDLRNL